MNARWRMITALLITGAGWGLAIPLSKVAVSTGHQPMGLIFWQMVIVVVMLLFVNRIRRRPVRLPRSQFRLFLVIALFGSLLPDVFYFMAAARLPAGVLAIVMSCGPIFSLPIALMMGNDRFSWIRLLGLLCGLFGIFLLFGPEASLPDRAMAAFIPIAVLGPIFYALEGNLVARMGTGALDPVQALIGASLLGAVLSLPLAVLSGQWIDPIRPWGAAEWALVGTAAIHGLVYSAYVWLVGRAGSVFASQVSYLVTAFGVLWSIALLSERYSGYVWLALGVMLVGIFLVRPRARIALAPVPPLDKTEADLRGPFLN